MEKQDEIIHDTIKEVSDISTATPRKYLVELYVQVRNTYLLLLVQPLILVFKYSLMAKMLQTLLLKQEVMVLFQRWPGQRDLQLVDQLEH